MSAIKIIIKPNCDMFVDVGGGEVFWGNTAEEDVDTLLAELTALLNTSTGHAT